MTLKSKLPLLLIYAVAACLLIGFPKWHMDDAYISFRYAAHFAAHEGLTFNPGVQPPVEGYTGLLWTVIMGLFIRGGYSPLIASHVLGVTFFLLSIAILGWMLRRMDLHGAALWLSLALYVTAPIFYVHALSGLETSFYILLVLSSFFAFWEVLQHPASIGRRILLIGLLCAASFTRPEGVFLMLLLAASAGLFLYRDQKKRGLYFAGLCVAILIIPQAGYWLWKYGYYGYLLPNTFYAKKFNGFLSLEAAIGFGKMLLKYFTFPTMLILLTDRLNPDLYPTRVREVLHKRKHVTPFAATLAFFICVVLFQYSRSNLQMGLSHRFFAPFFPLLLVVLAFLFEAASDVWRLVKIQSPGRWHRFLLWFSVFALIQAAVLAFAYQKERLYYQTYMTWLNQGGVRAGKLLRATLPASAWLATINDAGACPYYSDMRTVDFGRLCDVYLAHHLHLSNAENAAYFFRTGPAAVLITNGDYDRIEAGFFSLDPRFKTYSLVMRYGQALVYPHEFLFIRNDFLKGVCTTVVDPRLSEETRHDVADLVPVCRQYLAHPAQWPLQLPLDPG